MANITVDNYGFNNIEVQGDIPGARVKITKFADDGVDVGFMTVVNGRGLGGSHYIRNKSEKELQSHIKHINQIIWITQQDKADLIKFINDSWGEAA